jgi:hypothetical protein
MKQLIIRQFSRNISYIFQQHWVLLPPLFTQMYSTEYISEILMPLLYGDINMDSYSVDAMKRWSD